MLIDWWNRIQMRWYARHPIDVATVDIRPDVPLDIQTLLMILDLEKHHNMFDKMASIGSLIHQRTQLPIAQISALPLKDFYILADRVGSDVRSKLEAFSTQTSSLNQLFNMKPGKVQ